VVNFVGQEGSDCCTTSGGFSSVEGVGDKFMYLSNDLFSVEKDWAVGGPNYSVIYACQFDVPLPVAIECVRNIRREALASFWEACHVAKQNVTKPDHIWFLGFIEDLVRAFDSAMETDKNRYGGT
jgi:hypothetical protein